MKKTLNIDKRLRTNKLLLETNFYKIFPKEMEYNDIQELQFI